MVDENDVDGYIEFTKRVCFEKQLKPKALCVKDKWFSMNNIGVVLYKKGDEPGTLNAEYCHTDDGKGSGIAVGGSTQGFEGKYHIRYFDEKGKLQAERGLEIKKDGDRFNLMWFNNKAISGRGIGFETIEGLLVGYYDV